MPSSGREEVAAEAEWSRYRIVAGLVTSSSPVPLKIRRVGERCTLNLSRAQTFTRWSGARYTPVWVIGRGRGSRVVKVSDRGLPCHEFEPSATKDPPCRAAMHTKSAEISNVLPLVWCGS
ncbi:hypothetical protein TNCV_2705431 [Trichonephila clavipes]|nr:hypothetical protein TNCV_2705431 [Trichonephila clavipes]